MLVRSHGKIAWKARYSINEMFDSSSYKIKNEILDGFDVLGFIKSLSFV
jgi:hypothetical protein